MVERPCSAGGQPRRFFRIPGRREYVHEKERGRNKCQKRRKNEIPSEGKQDRRVKEG